MPTGDSLSVFLFLAATSLAGVMGALTARPGWRMNALLAIAVVFGLAAIMWLAAPAASPIVQVLEPIAIALLRSGALVMVGVVAIVALMLGGRQTSRKGNLPAVEQAAVPREDQPPAFAVTSGASKWQPDTSFVGAMLYLHETSRWGAGRNRRPQDISQQLTSALQNSKISSWGRAHPSEREFQIRPVFWRDPEIKLESGTVFSKTLNASAYEVRLCRGELEAFWPPIDPAPESSA